jgi:hypothetical protein
VFAWKNFLFIVFMKHFTRVGELGRSGSNWIELPGRRRKTAHIQKKFETVLSSHCHCGGRLGERLEDNL